MNTHRGGQLELLHRGVAMALGGLASTMAYVALAPAAWAVELKTGNEDLKARWDNTVKYSAGWRVKDQSPALLANLNGDDGNRNFNTGLISNRADLLSEFDLTYKNVGMRVSGAAWYDAVYNRSNNNDSPATVNAFSVPHNEFTAATRKLHGKRAEILDALVFGNGHIADMEASFRAGKHTLLWGESLLLATNGISYAQAPLDAIKAQSVPGSQAKELFLPVEQVSVDVRPSATLDFAGYYQYKWRKTRVPGAGSYFSTSDLLDAGGESLLQARRPGAALLRGADLTARDHGQWGLAARYRAETLATDFGLYYLRFHEKVPQVYLAPESATYFLAYPEDIRLIGASFSTQLGTANVAGELHVRRHTPLASKALSVAPGSPADNSDNPLYAIGNTVHAQVSVVYPLPSTAWWPSGTVSAEVGAVRRTSVTRNAGMLDPGRERNAWGFSVNFTPSYFQVLPNLDLNVPVSLSYNPKGKSPAAAFNGDKTGSLSLGLSGEYRKIWTATLRFTTYLGPESRQPLSDRDNISLSVQRTF